MATPVPSEYAAALRREILRSELQRMRAVAIILAALLTVTMVGAWLFTGLTQRLFRGGIEVWMPAAIIGPFILYEIAAVGILRWRAARDLDFPRLGRFGNALVETSLPGVIIYVLAQRMEPQLVFGFWPPLLYFLFILLSTLRLDFWLSLWTGAVAAVQQMALAVWFLPLSLLAERANETVDYHLAAAWSCWRPAWWRDWWRAACGGSSTIRSRRHWRATA